MHNVEKYGRQNSHGQAFVLPSLTSALSIRTNESALFGEFCYLVAITKII